MLRHGGCGWCQLHPSGRPVPPTVAWTLIRFYKYYLARCGNSTAVCSALRALGIPRPSLAARGARCENKMNYYTSRDACCKRTVKCSQRSGVSALLNKFAPARLSSRCAWGMACMLPSRRSCSQTKALVKPWYRCKERCRL